MITFIKDWVLNIVMLVLFIVMIEMLLPEGRMKKYAGLVTGIILIIAIINPFLKLVGGKVRLSEIQTANSNFLDKSEIQSDSKLLKDDQMKQIIEVYRKKLISQLEDAAKDVEGAKEVKADVIINEDYNSDLFGEIKRVYLEVGSAEGKEGEKPVAQVEKIDEVEKIKVGRDEGEKPKNMEKAGEQIDVGSKKSPGPDPALVKRLEERISGLYGVDKENIVISVPKG